MAQNPAKQGFVAVTAPLTQVGPGSITRPPINAKIVTQQGLNHGQYQVRQEAGRPKRQARQH